MFVLENVMNGFSSQHLFLHQVANIWLAGHRLVPNLPILLNLPGLDQRDYQRSLIGLT